MSWCQATYAFSSFSVCTSDTGYLHINLESSRIIFGPSMSFTGFRMLLCVAIWKTHCCFMWMLWKEYWEACLPGKDIYRFSIHSIPFKQFERICQLVRILKDKISRKQIFIQCRHEISDYTFSLENILQVLMQSNLY